MVGMVVAVEVMVAGVRGCGGGVGHDLTSSGGDGDASSVLEEDYDA
jgi:hypothetical protein